MYYRVHSDRLVEELRNTVDDDEQLGILIYIYMHILYTNNEILQGILSVNWKKRSKSILYH